MNYPEFIQKINWRLLVEQKRILFMLSNGPFVTPVQQEAIDGILSLIDSLQDFASEDMGLGDEEVFNLKDE